MEPAPACPPVPPPGCRCGPAAAAGQPGGPTPCPSCPHRVVPLALAVLVQLVVGAEDAVAVEQGGLQPRQRHVPHIPRLVALWAERHLQRHPPRPQVCLCEQAQRHAPGVGGKHGKVGGALRVGSARWGRGGGKGGVWGPARRWHRQPRSTDAAGPCRQAHTPTAPCDAMAPQSVGKGTMQRLRASRLRAGGTAAGRAGEAREARRPSHRLRVERGTHRLGPTAQRLAVGPAGRLPRGDEVLVGQRGGRYQPSDRSHRAGNSAGRAPRPAARQRRGPAAEPAQGAGGRPQWPLVHPARAAERGQQPSRAPGQLPAIPASDG